MLHAALLALVCAPLPPAPAGSSIGPPAVCFPLEIGDARTLPWGGAGPFDVDPGYGQERLVPEVVAVLSCSDEALVHAETLRRAVIYLTEGKGRKASAARAQQLELVAALQARVLEAELASAQGSGDQHQRALCWMDVGYVLGAFDQMGVEPIAPALPALRRSCDLAPEDGGVALAAWLAAWTRGSSEADRGRLLADVVRLAQDPSGPVRVNLMNVAGMLLGVDTYDQLAAKVRGIDQRGG
jgi:hypothetical protein